MIRPTSALVPALAVYELPYEIAKCQALGSLFLATLAKDNISLQYNSNQRLANGQDLNFAPRIGFAYQPKLKTVVRGGFGLFYGGLQSEGNTNLGTNFPWSNSANLYSPSCAVGQLPLAYSEGVTLETGLIARTGTGLQNFVSTPSISAIDARYQDAIYDQLQPVGRAGN